MRGPIGSGYVQYTQRIGRGPIDRLRPGAPNEGALRLRQCTPKG